MTTLFSRFSFYDGAREMGQKARILEYTKDFPSGVTHSVQGDLSGYGS